MQCVSVPAQGSAVRTHANQLRMVLCSRVRGRERWHVPALEGNPRLAAAIALVLQSEKGIEEVQANPLTGRVLVRYRPGQGLASMETLVRRALEFGPMSREEYAAILGERRPSAPTQYLVAAEVGCFFVKMMLFGGFCPHGAAAAALFLLLKYRTAQPAHCIPAVSLNPCCLVVDQAG